MVTIMYETLILLKPGSTFQPEQMEELVSDMCAGEPRTVTREDGTIIVQAGASSLRIVFNDGPSVAEESHELAEEYGVDCADCTARYEMNGEDHDMELFNDHVIINERLEDLDKFVILYQSGEL